MRVRVRVAVRVHGSMRATLLLAQADANAFHGRTPAVSEVLPGDVEDAATRSDGRTLLLCYPPANDAMGANCLQAFR